MSEPLALEVVDLHVAIRRRDKSLELVRGVSFQIASGGSLGLVGESGSGKSLTALALLRLVEEPIFISSGAVRIFGGDVLSLSEAGLRAVRGKDVGMVFQEPMAALNPVYTVRRQMVEAIRAHQSVSKEYARARALELLDLVGIVDPHSVLERFPHQLSGGMAQRVTIAIALANDPRVLVLDEPTTALDATVQAQVLSVVQGLRRRVGAAILVVSHDVAVVAEVCDDVAVMYGGLLMECGPANAILADPKHPYTEGLVRSALSVGESGGRLSAIPGEVPGPESMPIGCPFSTRCRHRMAQCDVRAELQTLSDGRRVACWLYASDARSQAGSG